MKRDVPLEEFRLAVARSSAQRLADLRACHDAISDKQRELMAAANRGDVETMQSLNEQILVLGEVATDCVRRILASAAMSSPDGA